LDKISILLSILQVATILLVYMTFMVIPPPNIWTHSTNIAIMKGEHSANELIGIVWLWTPTKVMKLNVLTEIPLEWDLITIFSRIIIYWVLFSQFRNMIH